MPLRQVTHRLMLTARKVRQERVITSKLDFVNPSPGPVRVGWPYPSKSAAEQDASLWNTEHEE